MKVSVNKIFPVVIVVAVIVQMFYWSGTSDAFFDNLNRLKVDSVEYVAVYSNNRDLANQSVNSGSIITEKSDVQSLMNCIKSSEEIPKIGLDDYLEKKYFTIRAEDGINFDFEIVFSKKHYGYLGLYYRYRNEKSGEVFTASGKKVKSQCLYQWFYDKE